MLGIAVLRERDVVEPANTGQATTVRGVVKFHMAFTFALHHTATTWLLVQPR